MSVRFFALVLVASQICGFAVAKETGRYLLDEDRHLNAQSDAPPTPARPAPARALSHAQPAQDETWRSNANGS